MKALYLLHPETYTDIFAVNRMSKHFICRIQFKDGDLFLCHFDHLDRSEINCTQVLGGKACAQREKGKDFHYNTDFEIYIWHFQT